MNIAGYEVLGELGRGGMGVVLRVRAPDGALRAMKVLTAHDPEARARFAREVRLLAGLGETEGFVPLLDSGDSPTGPFFVMPLLEAGTLARRLTRGPLPIDEVIALGRTLARAIGRAHEKGVVHRDLKPANVLFAASGAPLIADLGIAKHFAADAPGASRSVALSRSQSARGTPGYMAPEQMIDAKSVGPAADVFALGGILYECATGEVAFTGETPLALAQGIAAGLRSPVRSKRPEAPRWLAAVIERALAADAGSRYPDGTALATALDSPPSSSRRTPVLAIPSVLVLVLGLFLHRRASEASRDAADPLALADALSLFAESSAPSPIGLARVLDAERALDALPPDKRDALAPRVVTARLLADLAHGTSASAVLARVRAARPPTETPLLAAIRTAAARQLARELVVDVARERTGEARARELLGADLPEGFDAALAIARARRAVEAWRPPNYDEGLRCLERLRSTWRSDLDVLVDRRATADTVAACLARVIEELLGPYREARPAPSPEVFTRFVAACDQLHAAGVVSDELTALLLFERVRYIGGSEAQAIEAARAVDLTRVSPDTAMIVLSLVLEGEINDSEVTKEPAVALRRLLDVARLLGEQKGYEGSRARTLALDALGYRAILAADLALLEPAASARLLDEAKAALAAQAELSKELQRDGLFRTITITARDVARAGIARVEGDAATLEDMGRGFAENLRLPTAEPATAQVVLAADHERRARRLDEAARIVRVGARGRRLGRDYAKDRELLTHVVAAERGEPGAREALRVHLARLATEGGLVSPWLRAEAEALLAR